MGFIALAKVVSPSTTERLRNDQVAMITHAPRTNEIHPASFDCITITVGSMRNQINVAELQLVTALLANSFSGLNRLFAYHPDGHDLWLLGATVELRARTEIGTVSQDTCAVRTHFGRAIPLEKVCAENAIRGLPDHHTLRRTFLSSRSSRSATSSTSAPRPTASAGIPHADFHHQPR
jgi:hypothetical protein